MAGKIQWQIELVGIDKVVRQLEKVDALMRRISGYKGGGFLDPNTQPRQRDGGPPNTHGGGGGSFSGAALGAAAGSSGKDGITRGVFDTNVALKQAAKELNIFANRFGKYTAETIKLQNEFVKQIQAGLIKLVGINQKTGEGVYSRTAKGLRNDTTTPATGELGSRGNLRTVIKDVLDKVGSGPFTGGTPPKLPTWKDAFKPENIFKEIKGKTEGVKTAFATEGLFGGLKALRGAFLGIVAAGFLLKKVFEVLKFVVELLVKGIEAGAKAYQQGAASGIGVRGTTQLEQALKSMGITEKPTFMMESAMQGGGGAQGVIGAARGSGFGGAQQLTNMAKEFEAAMKDASWSSRQMAQSAKTNQIMAQDLVGIQREWKTLLAQSSAALYPFIHAILDAIKDWLKMINLYIEFWNWIKSKIPGLLPSEGPGTVRGIGTGASPNGPTGMEKIGFTFGRGGPTEMLNKIGENTKNSSEVLSGIYEFLKIAFKLTGGPAGAATSFMP